LQNMRFWHIYGTSAEQLSPAGRDAGNYLATMAPIGKRKQK